MEEFQETGWELKEYELNLFWGLPWVPLIDGNHHITAVVLDSKVWKIMANELTPNRLSHILESGPIRTETLDVQEHVEPQKNSCSKFCLSGSGFRIGAPPSGSPYNKNLFILLTCLWKLGWHCCRGCMTRSRGCCGLSAAIANLRPSPITTPKTGGLPK